MISLLYFKQTISSLVSNFNFTPLLALIASSLLSSIVLNMQLSQLSGIVENAQINLLKIYFYKFKKQTLGI